MRIVVSIGVLWETPTATVRAPSGIAAARSGLTAARPSLTSCAVSSTRTIRRLRRPWTMAEWSSRTPAWNTPWNASVATRSATIDSTTGRAATATWEVVSCCSSASTICWATASRTAGSLSMSVVASANPCELANVRQLHTDTMVRFVSTTPTRTSADVLRPSRPERPPPSSPTAAIVDVAVACRHARREVTTARPSEIGRRER